MPIIDTQVNMGDTPFGPNSNVDDYILESRDWNPDKVIIFPTPTHSYFNGQTLETSCLWHERSKAQARYYAIVKENNGNEKNRESSKPI